LNQSGKLYTLLPDERAKRKMQKSEINTFPVLASSKQTTHKRRRVKGKEQQLEMQQNINKHCPEQQAKIL